MTGKKIFLTEQIHADAVAHLKKSLEVVQGTSVEPDDIVLQAQECEGILVRSAKITAAMMDRLPNLKVIAKHGIGIDNIDVEGAVKKGIMVVNAPFSNLNAVAEHSLALLLALSKNLVHLDKETRNGGFLFRTQYTNIELQGKTLGLVGFGRIARMLAKKVSGFEMQVLASDPYADVEEAKQLGVMLVSREDLIKQSDFISIHVPLMPQTEKMVNREFLRQMKATAYLVNASRGAVVDEQALVEAIQKSEIAGAGLDVFEPEPPKTDNPLFKCRNVIISPHNAALTDNALRTMAMDSSQGIIDYLSGHTPQYLVTPRIK